MRRYQYVLNDRYSNAKSCKFEFHPRWNMRGSQRFPAERRLQQKAGCWIGNALFQPQHHCDLYRGVMSCMLESVQKTVSVPDLQLARSNNIPPTAVAQCHSGLQSVLFENIWPETLSLTAISSELSFYDCHLRKFGTKLTGGLYVIYDSTLLTVTGKCPVWSPQTRYCCPRSSPPVVKTIEYQTCNTQ